MSDEVSLRWKSPGPVSTAFMRATAEVEILNGPIGGGKTRTVFTKHLRRAARQQQSRIDGIRKYKLCTVHQTYRQLWRATIPSWWQMLPRNAKGVDFTGTENAPACCKVDIELSDGTLVQFQNDFIAIGENAVEDVLRGFEPTAFFLNEMDLQARDVLTYAKGRAGRYPNMSEGGPTWYGVTGDCNAPELHNWLYLDMFKKTPDQLRADGVVLFRQPSGLSPQAENLDNLPGGQEYYRRQAKGAPTWYVTRMIENKPGFSRAGRPIYPEFQDHLHVASSRLDYLAHLPLLVGLDAGGSPAAVIAQRLANGQWRILCELVAEPGTGPGRFGENLAQLLHERFPFARNIRAWADPAAAGGVDREDDEKDWVEIVSARANIRIDLAPTNNPTSRWEAVRRPLSRLIDGEPGFVLCPEGCPTLREGFNSGYRFKKLPSVDVERYSEEADKNAYSHPHDALQYVLSAGGEDIEIRERAGHQRQRLAQASRIHDWDPFSR